MKANLANQTSLVVVQSPAPLTDLISFKEFVAESGLAREVVEKMREAGLVTPFKPVKGMRPKYYRSEAQGFRQVPTQRQK